MSGFDKEAERERLREKYEQDQEKRAATQRMSELLLKGATMTNSHCDACGDPIFRYDGQEFCPTCQATGEAADAPEAGDEGAPDADEAEVSTPTEDAPETADGDADPTRPSPPAVDTRERRPAPTAERSDDGHLATTAESASGDDAGSLDDARASLSRTLSRFTRAAEETDDPRRAAELLAAAREAAETLSALDDCRI
jgi:uncharacterized Zn finger protein (UPF0148 family)